MNDKQPTKCVRCGKKMPPIRTKDGLRSPRGHSMLEIDPKGYFCTLRCAAKFGVGMAYKEYKVYGPFFYAAER